MQQFKYTSNTCDNQCFHKYAIVYPKYANPCFQIFGRPPGQVIGGPGVKLGQCLATGTCGILDPLLKLVGLKSFEDILKTRSVWETCCKYANPYWKKYNKWSIRWTSMPMNVFKNMQLYIENMPIHVLKNLGGLQAQLFGGPEMS